MNLRLMLPLPPARSKDTMALTARILSQSHIEMNLRVNLKKFLRLKLELTNFALKNGSIVVLKRVFSQLLQPRRHKCALNAAINFIPNVDLLVNLLAMFLKLLVIPKGLPALAHTIFLLITIAMLQFHVQLQILHLHELLTNLAFYVNLDRIVRLLVLSQRDFLIAFTAGRACVLSISLMTTLHVSLECLLRSKERRST